MTFYPCLQWSHGLFCSLSIYICLWLPLHNDHMVFLFLIFQSVFACDFRYTLIIWSSLCDLSICICLWIPLYTDHMVFSLWSFNLYVLVNSVIQWSHGLSLCDLSLVTVSDSLFEIITFGHVVHFNVNMLHRKHIWTLNRWCGFSLCSFNLWLWANLVL